MAVPVSSGPRVRVDGKFFRLGETKFYAKGVAYGPFAPNAGQDGAGFASEEQTVRDFAQIVELGANVIRVYQVPPKWFLDLAASHQLHVLVDIPWNTRSCFLDPPRSKREALEAVRRGVSACQGHLAVFAFSLANEIPTDIVRWSGANAVADFIDELCAEARRIDPGGLYTFTNFPPTEFLKPQTLDFVCVNVYLHQERAFTNYLFRLQTLAEGKPLLLGEVGIDSLREGEARKCEMLRWQVRGGFGAGLAGTVIFTFTDDWWKDGRQIEDWQMGLTQRDRKPKDSYRSVQKSYGVVPRTPLARYPKISVVVANYNGERTLKACLQSLERLNYPNYEVLLVDDGSTDKTREIASSITKVRYLHHERNLGLSAARNTGIAAATGEIIAFTDADCRADEDWLYYLAADFLASDFVAIGGPNLPPPEDSPVAAAVMASPGGPAHVMLTDRRAEHIPGCNFAAFKWALTEIGGFDPIFHRAGDDVDVCWRLQQAGYKIGFSPAAFVWHYRRPTVQAYLAQQHGYGQAEALLVRKHPENFNSFGGSIWRGRIYTHSKFGWLFRPPIIYRGHFASAGFQSLYSSDSAASLMLCATFEYHVLIALPLWILTALFHPLLLLAVVSLIFPVACCIAAAVQAELPRDKVRPWTRPLVAALFFLQPLVRGWARYQERLLPQRAGIAPQPSLDSEVLAQSRRGLDEVSYSSPGPLERLAVVKDLLRRLGERGWPHRADIGWSEYDVEIYDARWCKLQVTTAVEERAVPILRCRLRPCWSLRAKAGFWMLCGLELLVLSLIAPHPSWYWLLLWTLPFIVWLIRLEQRNLQSITIVLLDEMAKDWKWKRETES